MFKRLLIGTLIIYFGYGFFENYQEYKAEASCLGWNCEQVACPDGYAVFIPEAGRFIRCEHLDIYLNTGNQGLFL